MIRVLAYPEWVSKFGYLGVFIVSLRSFKCSLLYAKRSFYAAVNGLFKKLLNLASEEVILELVRTKCTPILLYGKSKFSHTRYQALGPELIPVYRQSARR